MFSEMYPLKRLHVLITDEEATKEDIEMIKAQGVEVIIAKKEE